MRAGQTYKCRVHIENAGERGWLPLHRDYRARVLLGIFIDRKRIETQEVTQDVHRGERWHFVFEVTAPHARRFLLRVQLLGEHEDFSERSGPVLVSEEVVVERPSGFRPTLQRLLRPILARAAGSRPGREA